MADSSKQKLGSKRRITPKEFSREVLSLSLFAQIHVSDPNKKIRKEFSLGMSEWMDDADEESCKENRVSSSDDNDFKQQPATKKTRLDKQSLSPTKATTSKNHFAECVTTTQLALMTKLLVPKNMQKNTGCALCNFCKWRENALPMRNVDLIC